MPYRSGTDPDSFMLTSQGRLLALWSQYTRLLGLVGSSQATCIVRSIDTPPKNTIPFAGRAPNPNSSALVHFLALGSLVRRFRTLVRAAALTLYIVMTLPSSGLTTWTGV